MSNSRFTRAGAAPRLISVETALNRTLAGDMSCVS